MTVVKKASTNQINKKLVSTFCPVTFTLNKIGGRWKPVIIYNLLSGTKRYNELKKSIPNISEKMLIQHLKELEADALLARKAKHVVPPHVEYSLTTAGRALAPVLKSMCDWAGEYNV